MSKDVKRRTEPNQSLKSARFTFEQSVGVALLLFSSLGLVGWMFGIMPLISVLQGAVTMKVNAALSLFLSGTALLLVHRGGARGLRVARGCALAVGAIGFLTLLEHATGWNIGIDEFFFYETGTLVGTVHPGRMSPYCSASVLLSAVSLWLMSRAGGFSPWRLWALECLGSLVVMISLLGLLGYLVGFDVSPTLWRMTALAIHTAVLFLLLGIAMLAFARREGRRRWLIGRGLTIVGTLALVMLIVVASISYRTTTDLLKYSEDERLTRKTLSVINLVTIELEDSPYGAWGYVITGQEDFIKEHQVINTRVQSDLTILHELLKARPYLEERLATIEPLVAERVEFLQKSIDLRRTTGFESARLLIATGHGRQLSDEIRTQFSEMRQELEAILVSEHALVEDKTKQVLSVLPLGLLLSLALFTAVLFKLNAEITRRDQVARSLKHTELLKTSILDSLPAEIVMLDSDGEILDVNEPWLHFSREQGVDDGPTMELGSNYLEVCSKAIVTKSPYAEAAIKGIREVLDGTRREFQLEYPRTSSGQAEWITLQAIGILHEPKGALVSHLNITETRRAKNELRESEARFRSVADNTPVLIWEAGLDKGCYYFNKCWLEFTGRTLSMESGNGWAEGVHPDDFDRCLEIYVNSFERREKFRMEYRLRRADGEFRTLVDTGVPRYDAAGEFLGYIGSCLDITEIKEAQSKVLKVNAELEQRVATRTQELQLANTNIQRLNDDLEARATKLNVVNEELESFSYSVSHDLRTPVRAIDGYAHMMMEDCGPQIDDNGRRLLQVICDETARMSCLIDDLLSFSQISRQRVEPVAVNMHVMAQEVYKELMATQPDRTVAFDLQELPPTIGTPTMIRQIWINLISNALKFTSKCPKAIIEIGAEMGAGGSWVYHIKDNGAGFDMRHAHKLFGVFERLHTQPDFEGTGVGLALVKRIVERHGGRIWAESEVDQGACFFFTLPEPGPMPEDPAAEG
ncbi:MAG: CHASE3 domain-containing protein [Verrucomicrobiae bacterium]|nr:CHASE3 domain-containing protein [Verrucomicrobiae bacterium]NNJ43935.1 PAS domain S-box protein [Akkermansiaceae bacterium]